MEKNTIIGLGSVTIILVAIVWYAALHPTPAKAPTISETASSTATSTSPDVEHGTYYDITMSSPTTTPLTVPANTAAIAVMQGFVQQTVSEFKNPGGTSLDAITPAQAAQMGLSADRKYTLQSSYLIGSSEHTISYIFTVYEDTGGAHGNIFFKTFVFDKNSGALLALNDLFQSGSNYLTTLSGMARGKLPTSIGQGADVSMIRDGTTPEDKNFQSFFFDGSDFVVVFSPYQVASYAAGPQTLRIASSDLHSILKSQYP